MAYDLQKANMLKRVSAYIFDFILLVTLAVGIAALLSGMVGYDDHTAKRQVLRAEYEAQWGVSFDIPQEDYAKLTEEQRALYDRAYAAFATDTEVNELDMKIINLTLLITVFGILIPYLLLEFGVPMLLGHGRTLGKKIFGLAVMRTNGVKLGGQAHFIRSIIGRYTMETMVPIYILLMILFGNLGAVGTVMLVLILLLEIFTMCYTKTRSTIHDLVSDTVVVDFQSQMIFESEEELIAYKTRIHEEEVNKREY
jgi:uncharacterized RDD family membrane protein YckC